MGNALEASAGRAEVMIIGGGPTGIGAAYRLAQHGNRNWILLDAEKHPGGLAGSIKTHEGFRFDHGYKTFCSRYDYLDQLIEDCFGSPPKKLKEKARDNYVYVKGRMIRFPLQNNLSGLPEADQINCALDLVRARITDKKQRVTEDVINETDKENLEHREDESLTENSSSPIENTAVIGETLRTISLENNEQRNGEHVETLDEYLVRKWGESLCNILFRPYIFKSFAYPTSKLVANWAENKIPPPQLGDDIERILNNEQRDPAVDIDSTTLYPSKGGLVSFWRNITRHLPKNNVRFKSEIIDLDIEEKMVRTKDGLEIQYDTLISTMPLTSLLELAGRTDLGATLTHSSLYIVCLGVRGISPHRDITGCIYFPESDTVFHRACIFSSFDPDSVPRKDEQIPTMRLAKETDELQSSGNQCGPYWSLQVEVSAGPLKTVSDATIMDEVVRDACLVGLLRPNDEIVSIHITEMTHGQPLPTIESEQKIDEALMWLQERGIYSRGRFGAFKYHLGDLDHCFIQGVEAVDHILKGDLERCLWSSANDINRRGKSKIEFPLYNNGISGFKDGDRITAGDVRNAITREPGSSTSSFTSTTSPSSSRSLSSSHHGDGGHSGDSSEDSS
uniref:uncharacterized protein LOC120346149 n=1 Tax=Styela clava TaxID=7725 RepID=UPI00193A0C2A|nr:uncharacterized protein LOC120346149 [Styela clava]